MNKKRYWLFMMFVAIGFVLTNSNYQFQFEVIPAGSWESVARFDSNAPSTYGFWDNEADGIEILDMQLPFVTSAIGDNYVDATYSTTYGTVSNGPPNGMGNSGSGPTDDTHLVEASYTSYSYTTMTSYTGGSMPSGWTSWQVTWSTNEVRGPAGWQYSSGTIGWTTQHNMGAYGATRIRWSWKNVGGESTEANELKMHYYAGGGYITAWNSPAGYNSGYDAETYIGSASSDVKVRWSISGMTGDVELWEQFYLDNLYLEGRTSNTYYRFQAVFRFDSVDYSYAKATLYIDFYTALTGSDDLDFYVEAGDTTPDYLVADNKQNDFSVDVSSYITGSTIYLDIRDDYRTGDTVQTTAYIQKCYLKIENTAPVIDAVPALTNGDNGGSWMFPITRYYEITANVSDADGYSHITNMYLRMWNDARSSERWCVRYYEDTNTFSEYNDPNYVITLDIAGSVAVRSGNDIDLTFKIRVEWTHLDTPTCDMYLEVNDANTGQASSYYESNWNVEPDIIVNSPTLNDGLGTADHGPINGDITASGTVVWQGTSAHPLTTIVDVFILCSDVATSPWEATNYEDSGGTFSVTVKADDIPGTVPSQTDTYDFKVVEDGDGSGGVRRSDPAEDTYIADRILVYGYGNDDGGDTRINVGATAYLHVYLQYEATGQPLIDGTVTVNSLSATYSGSGQEWDFDETKGTVYGFTYNNVVCTGNDAHGISIVNQNGESILQVWDQIEIYSIIVSDSHLGIGYGTTLSYYLRYDYDNVAVNSGGTYSTDETADNLVYQSSYLWQATANEAGVGPVTFNGFTTCSDAGHGLTAWTFTGSQVTVTWDRVRALAIQRSDDRCNYGSNQWVQVQFDYESAGYGYVTSWSTYPTISGPNGVITLDQDIGSGWWRGSTGTYSSVARFDYNTNTLNDFIDIDSVLSRSKGTYTEYTIWDQIEVYWSTVFDARDNVGDQNYPCFRLRLKYDNHLLNDGTNDAVYINSSVASWYVADSYWYKFYTQTTVGTWNFIVTSASENSFGITAFDSTSAVTYDQDIIWDAIMISYSLDEAREDIGSQLRVRAYLTYASDGTNLVTGTAFFYPSGSASISSGIADLYPSQSSVGKWDYYVSSVTGDTYGITVISIWDWDGGDTDYLYNSAVSESSVAAFTYTFWLKSSDNTYSGTVLSCHNGITGDNEILLLNYNNFGPYIHQSSYGASGIDATDGTWNHWAWQWRSSDGIHKIYKNGVLVWTSNAHQQGITLDIENIVIGQEQDSFGGNFDAGQAVDGEMADVRFYLTYLDAYKIHAIYQRYYGFDSNLLIAWNLYGTDVDDALVDDKSANNLDATIYGITTIAKTSNLRAWSIWDRIQVQSYSFDDSRININTAASCHVTLWYDYDNTIVTDGSVTVNGVSATYSGASGIWNFGETKTSVQGVTYNDVQATGNTYGITVEDQNSQSLLQVWDQVLVTLIDADGVYLDPDTQVNLTVSLEYEYDSVTVTAGTFSLRYGSTYLTLTHDVSGNWTVSDVSSNPTSRTYNYVNGTASLYGINIVNIDGKSVTVHWGRIILTVWINHHWRVIGYNTTIWYTGVFEGQGWTWNGTATFNGTGNNYPVESNPANYTFSVQSITDPDYGVTAFTADDVWCIFDDASVSSVGYNWLQYTATEVFLYWSSGTWTWEVNGTTLDTGAETDCIIRSYMNETQDDYAIVASNGDIGDLIVGGFGPNWYWLNLTINVETTVNGSSYDWTVWSMVLYVEILHSIHIVDSVVYLTDNYVTIGVYTNWDNASIIVWDQLISNTVPVHFQPNEGWFQILKSDVVGAHNLTILVNGTHSGATYDGNIQDWSENDAWEWFQFVYTISETVLTYETSIVVIDNLGEVIAFETFEVYRNDTRIYQPLIVTYSSYAYNITVKDRWGEVLNSTIFASGDYEFVLTVTVYSLKIMSWYEDFCYFNITHGGITYTEVIAPLETIYFRLYEGSYNWGVNYRNGTSVGGNLNLVNSTAIVVTGNTIADIAGLSSQILEMTTEINVTVYSTYDQTVTICIDLSNVNSTIFDQTINILTNIENSNSTIYSQTVSLLADISNVNSTLYAQTVTILADLQNINSTLYSQTVSILTMVQSVNSTLYNATISVFNHISAVNSTLYGMLVDLVNDISVVNSTIYGDLIVDLDNIWNGVSTLDTKVTYTNTKISNVKKALADDIADNSTMVATMNIVGIATVILSGVIVAIMVKYKKIQFFSDDELAGEEAPPEDEWSEDVRDFKKALKIGSNDADGKFTRRRNDTSTREEQRQKSDEVNDRWRRRKQIT